MYLYEYRRRWIFLAFFWPMMKSFPVRGAREIYSNDVIISIRRVCVRRRRHHQRQQNKQIIAVIRL